MLAVAVGACALVASPPRALGAQPAGATSDASTAARAPQSASKIDVLLPAPPATAREGPVVRLSRVLDDDELRDLIRNGFPARLHFRVELWTVGRWVDDLDRKVDWDVFVRYDPLQKLWRVLRVYGEQFEALGQFADYGDAVAVAERSTKVPILPPKKGKRAYYNAVVDVEVLSVSDLDELEQWLRGELRPSLQGKRNPATALTRGARTLLVRLLGGEKRRYAQRSATFRAQ